MKAVSTAGEKTKPPTDLMTVKESAGVHAGEHTMPDGSWMKNEDMAAWLQAHPTGLAPDTANGDGVDMKAMHMDGEKTKPPTDLVTVKEATAAGVHAGMMQMRDGSWMKDKAMGDGWMASHKQAMAAHPMGLAADAGSVNEDGVSKKAPEAVDVQEVQPFDDTEVKGDTQDPENKIDDKTASEAEQIHADVAAAQSNDEVEQHKSSLDKHASELEEAADLEFEKKAKSAKQGKLDAEALMNAEEEKEASRQQIQDKARQLKAEELETHSAIVIKVMNQRNKMEAQKTQAAMDEESTKASIEDELPKKIEGLNRHGFDDKPLKGTESHPFKEVERRKEGLEYNRERDHVVALAERLARLEKEAQDAGAAEQFSEQRATLAAQEDRQKDQDEDDLDCAKLPKEQCDTLKKMQEEMMASKMEKYKAARTAQLQKEVQQAAAVVEDDKKQIASVKNELDSAMGANSKFSSVAGEVLEQVGVSSDDLDNEESPKVTKKMLLKEVALLEQQQRHMMKALTKKLALERNA